MIEIDDRSAEIELARWHEEHRDALVRALLFGTLPLAELRSQLLAYGFDPMRMYVAVRASPATGTTRRDLEAALGFLDTALSRPGLRVTVDGNVAGFLRDPPRNDIAGTVGVGPPRLIDELPESFRLATLAFRSARRSGRRGVSTVDDELCPNLQTSFESEEDPGVARVLEPNRSRGETHDDHA